MDIQTLKKKIDSLDPKVHKELRDALTSKYNQLVAGKEKTTRLKPPTEASIYPLPNRIDRSSQSKPIVNYHLCPHKTKENEKPRSPYLTPKGTLVIPFSSDPKYHWWNSGQNILITLKELKAPQEVIDKYKPKNIEGIPFK